MSKVLNVVLFSTNTEVVSGINDILDRADMLFRLRVANSIDHIFSHLQLSVKNITPAPDIILVDIKKLRETDCRIEDLVARGNSSLMCYVLYDDEDHVDKIALRKSGASGFIKIPIGRESMPRSDVFNFIIDVRNVK
jgi:hypothetical protein